MAVATSVEEVWGGPGRLAIGDPTGTSGSWTDLDVLENIDIALDFWRQGITNQIDQVLEDGNYGVIRGATITATVTERQASLLAAMFPEVTDNTSSVSYSTTFASLALPTLIVQPIHAYGDGVTSIENFWFPAVRANSPGSWIFTLNEGDDHENYDVEFIAARRASDQADQALKEDYQIFFQGDPGDAHSASPSDAWTAPTDW